MGTKILKSAVFIFLGLMLWVAMREGVGYGWIPLSITALLVVGVWRGVL